MSSVNSISFRSVATDSLSGQKSNTTSTADKRSGTFVSSADAAKLKRDLNKDRVEKYTKPSDKPKEVTISGKSGKSGESSK